jgi:hypothetical protein
MSTSVLQPMFMLHVQLSMTLPHIHFHVLCPICVTICPSPCYMSMSMLLVHVHAVSISMLHVQLSIPHHTVVWWGRGRSQILWGYSCSASKVVSFGSTETPKLDVLLMVKQPKLTSLFRIVSKLVSVLSIWTEFRWTTLSGVSPEEPQLHTNRAFSQLQVQ